MKIEKQDVISRYYRLWRENNLLYENWAKKFGLTGQSAIILYGIYEESEGITQRYLSEEWSISKQTIHSVLKDFEQKGWIILSVDSQDRRNKKITLTDTGRVFADQVIGGMQRLEGEVFKRMGRAQCEGLIAGYQAFNRLFEELIIAE